MEGRRDPTSEERVSGQVGEDIYGEFHICAYRSDSDAAATNCGLSDGFPVNVNSKFSAVDTAIDTNSVLPHLFKGF